MTQEQIETFWQSYLAALPPDHPTRQRTYVAESFGDNPALADELGALILAGTKTATCSALWEWEAEGSPLPGPGFLTIILDGRGVPLCIIETSEVTIRPYDQVDESFAYEEGEGDRSLAYWREAHAHYFTRTLNLLGKTSAPDVPPPGLRALPPHLPLTPHHPVDELTD